MCTKQETTGLILSATSGHSEYFQPARCRGSDASGRSPRHSVSSLCTLNPPTAPITISCREKRMRYASYANLLFPAALFSSLVVCVMHQQAMQERQ